MSAETPFHLFVECHRLRRQRVLLEDELGHTDFPDLLTKDAKVAVEWAISYFGIEQFDNVKEDSLHFPPLPGTIPQNPRGLTPQTSTGPGRRPRTSHTNSPFTPIGVITQPTHANVTFSAGRITDHTPLNGRKILPLRTSPRLASRASAQVSPGEI